LQVNQNRTLDTRHVGNDRVWEIPQFAGYNIGDNVRWDCDDNQIWRFALDRGATGSVLRRKSNGCRRRIHQRHVDFVTAKH
jgi:hypothetical protein